MRSCYVLASILILACTSLCTALSPTFLWSNTQAIAVSKVSYEVVKGTDVVLSSFLSATGKKPASPYLDESSPQPDCVVAYFGRHADAGFFRQTGSPAGPLESVLESAKSWLMFQYSNYQGEDSAATIYQQLAQAGVNAQSVGCDETTKTENVLDTAKLYIANKEGPKALLVCSGAADAAEEVAEAMALNKALSDSGRSYLAVYATEARPSDAQQRTLKESSELTCGPLCKTQAGWLQGILAGGVLLMALVAGLSCTYLLDSPSKFEAPKDASTTIS